MLEGMTGCQSGDRSAALHSALRTIHDAVKRVDHAQYGRRVPRRTSDIQYNPHVLQQDGAESAAPGGIGTAFIESQQSLHQKGDAPGLARCFTPRVLPKNRIVRKTSGQGLRQSFDIDAKAGTEMDGFRDGGDADE